MTTLQPRPPYTTEEVKELYPPGLQLQLVQVVRPHLIHFRRLTIDYLINNETQFFRHGRETLDTEYKIAGLIYAGERTPEHARFQNVSCLSKTLTHHSSKQLNLSLRRAFRRVSLLGPSVTKTLIGDKSGHTAAPRSTWSVP